MLSARTLRHEASFTQPLISATVRRMPSPEAERARLRRHFAATIDLLSSRSPRLSPERRRERAALLRELERYARREQFPRNRRYPGRKLPIFVDEGGNRCAVGHLMEVSGAGETVMRVHARSNLARVHALAAQLAPWADAVGISLEEAARIQPGYCFVTPAYECLCGSLGGEISGVLEGQLIDTEDATLLRVDMIHGQAPHVVGDEIQVYPDFKSPDLHALVPVQPDGTVRENTVVKLGLDELSCGELSAPREVVLEAMLSNECDAVLEREDPAWTASPCKNDGGCSVSHGSVAAGASTLLALALIRLLQHKRRHR